MKRRNFVMRVGGLALAEPFLALAQRSDNTRRIGFLSLDTSDSTAGQQARRGLAESFQRLGYRLGRDLAIEWRWADGKSANLDELARNLVALKVDAIVARTTFPIEAAKRATATIPIVMLNGNFPVETGLVQSLAKPGANVTGTAYISAETLEKVVQVLKEVAPGTARVAALMDSGTQAQTFSRILADSLERGGARLGMTFKFFGVNQPEEIAVALKKVAASRPDAFVHNGSPLFRSRADEIMAFLHDRKLVSIGYIPDFAENGGLITYAPDAREFFDRTARYVDRILKGAKPGELPIEQPSTFNLVLNMKTAKALGITIPQSVLVRADRVIE